MTNAESETVDVPAGGIVGLVEYSTREFAVSFVFHVTTALEPSIAVVLICEITGPAESIVDSANFTST